MPSIANDNNPRGIVPRGLRRVDAARYLGVSPSLFDRKRKAGEVPSPKIVLGVTVWDRADLDRLFGDVDNDNHQDEWLGEPNPWDDEAETRH
jgi:hypothetical protein